MLHQLWKRLVGFTAVVFFVLPSHILAAGGGGEAIIFVADSRKYTGWEAWFTNLYNEDLAWFTVVTLITIPTVALTFGSLMSFIMSRTGINLKSRVVAEH